MVPQSHSFLLYLCTPTSAYSFSVDMAEYNYFERGNDPASRQLKESENPIWAPVPSEVTKIYDDGNFAVFKNTSDQSRTWSWTNGNGQQQITVVSGGGVVSFKKAPKESNDTAETGGHSVPGSQAS